MKKVLIVLVIFIRTISISSQTEIEKIHTPLMDYIEGSSNGDQDRLKRAFHPDFNLYFVQKDTVRTLSGKGYISNIKQGQKSNRIGKIVSIDYVKDAAVAKIEIDMPDRKRLYTDYLILFKMKDEWKIIHKSFTFIEY